MVFAIVPVKDLWQAKQRLAGALAAPERRALCLAMLTDVLAALQRARRLSGVFVYSADAEAGWMARKAGFAVARDEGCQGQSAAVVAAMPHCAALGSKRIVTIPLDTPLITAADVEAVVDFGDTVAPPATIMVPSRDGTGTNALFLSPPEAMAPAFGPDSLARHTAEAVRLGLAWRHLSLPRLALDVDTPDDLSALVAVLESDPGAAPATARYLTSSGRLAPRVASAKGGAR